MNKTTILTALILLSSLGPLANAQPHEDHLVALYLFEEGSGDDVLDSSGNGNHGVIQGGGKWVDGKSGGGMEFNGSDAFVEIPHSDSLSLTTGLTIAMWGYLYNYSTAGGVGVTKESAYKAGMRDHQKMMIRFSTAAANWSNVVDGETVIPLDEWHHLAATYDSASGDCVVYYDGQEDGRGSFDGDIKENTGVIWIGRGANPHFDGIYDDVAIWDIALSEAEIASAMTGLQPVRPAGKLTSLWARVKGWHFPKDRP